MFCLLQLLHLFLHITSLKNMEVWQQHFVWGVWGGGLVFFCCDFFFFKEKDTRKDGRLQYVVKEESSPLKRQQDFGQEILISKHVRTQTDTEPRDAISLGILPFTDL